MKKNNLGQAVVEYMIVFAFITLIGINLIRGLGGFMGNSMGSLAYHLSQQLTIGVCASNCFGNPYKNKSKE
jgi:sorbitol-specific phosphotransferase system component IIBC